MKTRIHSYGSQRRPAGASISQRRGLLATLDAWLWPAWNAVIEIVGTGSRRNNHLRLIRRNGRPVPVPLRTVVKTRNPHIGRIAAAVILVFFLVAAGIGGSIYLGLQAPVISLLQ